MMEFYQTILILCSLLIISVESLMFHLEANARFELIELHEESAVNENVQEVPGRGDQERCVSDGRLHGH